MKARYLTFISYIGTRFRSSEKIWSKQGKNHLDPESVQGILEIALLKLRSTNFPKVNLSSRTDGGVHALNASAHIDLERAGPNIYHPDQILLQVNKFFFKHNYNITVNKCIRVSDTFSARYQAKSRTYLYRLAILKKEVPIPVHFGSIIPIEEWGRCHFLKLQDNNFDIEKFKEASSYLIGLHDFTSFKKFDKLVGDKYKHNRRLITSFDVRPGKPQVTSYSTLDKANLFDYYDIYICGTSFVHNQIRRMIGALIGVAIGKIQPEEIKLMLQIPSKHSWPHCLHTGPASGLYLCNVEYDEKDLIFDDELTKVSSNSESDRE